MKIFQHIPLSKHKKLSPTQATVLDFFTDVIVIFFIVLVIVKPLFFAPFRVQQESMMPNILDGEFIIVWKTPYVFGAEYERNDIIVFKPEQGQNYLIKRVIGLPGETLRIHEGFSWIEDEAGEFERLEENFLSNRNLGNTCVSGGMCSELEKTKPIDFEIPEGQYFVMGDNRLASRDSRSCFESVCDNSASNFLTPQEIEGKAVLAFARFWLENGEKNFSVANARILSTEDADK